MRIAMLNTIIWALLGAVAVVALPTRQLSALQQAAHVQTPDIANAFIRQMKTKSIAHLLMLDNSLATPYYREVAKRGLGYTCVSVDDNTDPSHRLDRVYRVNRMGDLHPAYASSGTLAVAITVDTPVPSDADPKSYLQQHRLNDNSSVAKDISARARWLFLVEAASSNGMVAAFWLVDISSGNKTSFAEADPENDHSSTRSIMRQTFERVYANLEWGAEAEGSGPGSTLAATAELRAELPHLLAKYNIRSIYDAGCGSMHWMPSVLAAYEEVQPGLRYKGVDVTCSLIDEVKLLSNTHPNWEFECGDVTESIDPGYDLVIARELMQHLPLASGRQFLSAVKASNATYLLATSYPDWGQANVNIEPGESFHIDLQAAPFSIEPGFVELLHDGNKTTTSKLLLMFDAQNMTGWLQN